ncbi:glycerophosphodiester phosphodiesterase [Alsobacter soli]|uniref:Glycerophosphodiester phosphodiesterase n=1 Tax=Alsobacter soli TaxID=2109933 RepID=A0A2T1HN14_9HYPH|nr:glycerophosphodiester phosphodiesterase family protein [Alsobacter soli]PSC03023.1 glycerophosphodiester phosphodiesterase [Alsobacter soli]
MAAPAWLVARPIAHRGLHDRAQGVVENTASAARAAIDRNFAIECDVQLTRDLDAVVFHDFALERLTVDGTGRVAERSAAELGGLALKDTSDRIQTLGDFLAVLGGRVPLVLEIKSAFDGDVRLARRTAEVLKGYDGPVAIKSFDPEIVAALRELAPDRPRGIVAENRYDHGEYARLSPLQKHAMANLLHYERSRPDFLSWQVQDLQSAAPYLCRKAVGLPVMTWTVRTPEDRERAAAGADQMVFEGFVP